MLDQIVEVTYDNAQEVLIDESFKRPVVIDFWADWCAPCKALMPLLEKLASAYQGAFLLAKLNADDLGDIASQFGVRSLPTVVLMKDGKPVDAFQGAQPESEIRAFLDKHLPQPWEKYLSDAETLITAGKTAEAVELLRAAYVESGKKAGIGLTLIKACLESHLLAEARALLAEIKMQDQNELYRQLVAQLELMEASEKSPAIQELEQRLNDDPDNLELVYELAVQFSQDGHSREALTLLYDLLQQDLGFNDGMARKVFMDILATLGKSHPLAVEFQRKFYTLLY